MPAPIVEIGLAPHPWRDVVAIADGAAVTLHPAVRERLGLHRRAVEAIAARGERAYGITTGLGALSDVILSREEIVTISTNTVRSHACAMGEPFAPRTVRAIMAGQILNFCHGPSGISPAVVDQIIRLLAEGITPVIPSQGSVGYISHTAHVGLALIGEGFVHDGGAVKPTAEALGAHGIAPLTLGAKEGLSLVNGTPCLAGLACLVLAEAERLADWADLIAAMSFEVLGGQIAAFDAAALAWKRHPGVQHVGARLRAALAGSQIVAANRGRRTQDALSIRSIPQIHGAIRDAIAATEQRVDGELASATDNPLVLLDGGEPRLVSQANPHGETVALALDALAIALAELGGVSERRLDRLVNPLVSGLPAFLVKHSGVNSGFMIAQYVAASIASENKILATPASVDNYVTSALQEDHLSLGTPAALKALRLAGNVQKILAVEYLAAGQAYEFMDGRRPGAGTAQALAHLRAHVPPTETDRFMSPDLAAADGLLARPCPVGL
ncbi:HAL/PAL/TAL family ammonia-lyase [Labrys wisconsinensis]|uniref:Histidine ammonia-lyase n=1 Tax=Labrys wisconsinensis TaxID=425677 RepID=A0ABU0JM62_9HYPH|nr:histidine ammonia-lyase [Labrys wisconsinensis]MDQ0475374.1 histidine ammonia-lyase [Labrys wisconsinensis]